MAPIHFFVLHGGDLFYWFAIERREPLFQRAMAGPGNFLDLNAVLHLYQFHAVIFMQANGV